MGKENCSLDKEEKGKGRKEETIEFNGDGYFPSLFFSLEETFENDIIAHTTDQQALSVSRLSSL